MSLWRHHDFLKLWAADTLSQVGTVITALAMPLLVIRVLDATAFEVGLLTTFEFLAFLVVGLPAGAWVDRMRRRNVLWVTDLLRAALFGSIPLAWWLDVLTLYQVYAVALLAGVATVFFDVAYQSYLPFLVGRDHLVEGNSKLQGTQSVAQVAGPPIAGVLIQVLTAPYAILVDALSFLWSSLWVRSISAREPVPERAPDRHLLREMREGLSFVLNNRLLRSIAACTGTSNLFSNVQMVALVVILADEAELNFSAGVIGLLFSTSAVGGLVGALLARRFAGWVGQGPAIWIPAALFGPLAAVVPFVDRGWVLGLVALSMFLFGVTVVVYNVVQVSFRQLLCPERLLGRMNASMRFLVWGTIPIGAFLGGVLSSTIGLRPTLWVAAAGGALAFLPVFFSPLRWMRELPTTYVDERAGSAAADPAASDPASDPASEPAADQASAPVER